MEMQNEGFGEQEREQAQIQEMGLELMRRLGFNGATPQDVDVFIKDFKRKFEGIATVPQKKKPVGDQLFDMNIIKQMGEQKTPSPYKSLNVAAEAAKGSGLY